MRGTAKFAELQEFFERTAGNTPRVYFSCGHTAKSLRANRAGRKPDMSWPDYFYENGLVDSTFRLFLSGYQFAAAESRLQGAPGPS